MFCHGQAQNGIVARQLLGACSFSLQQLVTSQQSWDSSFLACTKKILQQLVRKTSQLSFFSGLLVLQPEVLVDQEWRSNKNCLKTFPRHLLVLHKRPFEPVLLFAHASLEVLPDPQHLKVFRIFSHLPEKGEPV